MASLIAEYTTAGIETLRNVYGNNQCCQTFQLGVASARNALYIQHGTAGRQGTLGDITIAIYAVDDENKPTGPALGTVTIASTNWTVIPSMQTPMQTASVEFSDCTLQIETTYAIVISATDGNATNRIYWYSNDSGYADGVSFVSSDGGNTWTPTGEDFKFRVYGDLVLPEKPTNPTPTNAADDVTLDQATISWEDGGRATSYNVYYGENEAGLTLVSEGQVETSFTISGIDYGSPFDYVIGRTWRIDAINDAGTTTGDVWTFTTITFDPPLPTGVSLDAEGNPTGTPTGENNMYTVKRLIAAANNAIWYGGV